MTAKPYHSGKTILSASRLNETDLLARKRIRFGSGFKVDDLGRELRVSVVFPGGRGAAAAAGPLVRFVLADPLDDHSDYVVATQDGGEEIKVAKPWFLRGIQTWGGQTRLNIRYEYNLGGSQRRTATKTEGDTQHSEQQAIVPKYAAGDIIWATPASITDTHTDAPREPLELSWLDVNVDGRMWAAT